jgi:3-hydroxyacyl-[acyl-carrier-protein] dehydratase
MLKNSFYTLQDENAGPESFTAKASYNATHEIFGGHFPGQPVVPGVCTMQMVKELVEEQTGKKLLLQSTGQVKFLQLILPEVQPLISISWKETEGGYVVTAALKNDTADLFKMTGMFAVV